MNSFNHWAFGAVGEWMVQNIAGIQPDEQHPAWKHFIVRPRPGGGVTWADGSYNSIRGRIASSWNLRNGKLNLGVTIPANTTATVNVPAKSLEVVTESGQPARLARGVKFLRMEEGNSVFEVGSGSYKFRAAF